MAIRNEAGQTQEEFLAEYHSIEHTYPHPSLTADVVLFRRSEEKLYLLLIRRGNHPWIGMRALPGGFVNPDENGRQAAARELLEETGIEGLPLAELGLYSDPGRDPRAWIVTNAYYTLYDGELKAAAGDDARDAHWFEVQAMIRGRRLALMLVRGEEKLPVNALLEYNALSGRQEIVQYHAAGLACDHARIIADAYLAVSGLLEEET